MSILDFTTRILTAVMAGFLIGVERQLTGHQAGIRINVLVSLGTSIFVLFSIVMGAPDTTRIAAQIVTGVGFLCSGIIFKDGIQVRGLNTAATIWCTAAIGIMCCSGEIVYGVIATGILLFVNLLFRPLAYFIQPLTCFHERELYYKISIICHEDVEFEMRSLMMKKIEDTDFSLMNLKSDDLIQQQVEIEALFICYGQRRDEIAEGLVQRFAKQALVKQVNWELV